MNRALIVRSTKKRKIQPESEERGLREESKFLIAQCTEKGGKYISVTGLGISSSAKNAFPAIKKSMNSEKLSERHAFTHTPQGGPKAPRPLSPTYV